MRTILRYLVFAEDNWPREPGCAYGHINIVSSKIAIRGVQVMLDSDIAALFQVDVKRLNEQRKRNQGRFPEDFCFQLIKEEILRSQIATSSSGEAIEVAICDHDANKRNQGRFPVGFCFRIAKEERDCLRSQIVTFTERTRDRKFFTEQGIIALAGVFFILQ